MSLHGVTYLSGPYNGKLGGYHPFRTREEPRNPGHGRADFCELVDNLTSVG